MANQPAAAADLLEAAATFVGYTDAIADWQPFWETQPLRANPWLSTVIKK